MNKHIRELILTVLVCMVIVGGVAYAANFYPFSGGLSTGTGGLKSLTGLADKDGGVVILNDDATYGNAFFPFSLDQTGGCGAELAPTCIESGTAGRWWELTDVHGMNHYAWGTLPEFKLNDTDGAGTSLLDKHAGSLKANFTTTTEDAEVSDIYMTAYLAGTETNAVFYDGSATALLVHGHVVPDTVNSYTAGTALLPFTSIFIGDAATNNVQIINTDASSAKVATLPNVTGTFVVAATSATATQAMFATATAGAPAFRAIAAADLPATLTSGTAITNAALTTPAIGAATGTSLALGADPGDTANSAVMLSNAAVISWEDATEATITHVNDVGLKFNLPITLSNDESISNVDNTEITFVGTEAISLDLDTGTANEVAWNNRTTSSTGVTTMSFSALNLITSGTIQGKLAVTKDDDSLAAAQCYGDTHWYSGGAETITLPAAVVGMNLLIYSSDASVKNIDPNGTDTIVLTTAALAAGYQIESPGAAGDFIALVCFTANQWTALGRSGVWVTHGAD